MPASLELGLDQALALGQKLLRESQLEAAAHVYQAILQHEADQPDALHYMGLVLHRRGECEAGVQLMTRSIALAPGHAWMWNNLGNVLVEQGQVEKGLEAYEQCLALNPEAADAWNNLGSLHRRCGRLARSVDACRKAVELQPGYAVGWYNLARVLIERGEIPEGLVANSKAVVLSPREQSGRYRVARALVTLGEVGQAAAVYREWLVDEPDNPMVRHHLAACEGDTRQLRAPDGYIEQVFDSFASSFDTKLARLDYRAPQLIAGALGRRLPVLGGRRLRFLDAGCGTGLCGPLVREWAKRLVGVDLSAGMLKRAGQRAVYDTLEKAELVGYLCSHPAKFDVVISADTLCYFGDLSAFAQAVFAALRADGRLVFTVEASLDAGEAPFRLQPHGRYAHDQGYLRAIFACAGFIVQEIEQEVLRREGGSEVQGWIVNARKDDSAREEGPLEGRMRAG